MADNRLNVIISGRDDLTPHLRRVESGVIRAVGSISAALAAIRIGSAPLTAAIEFEKELANVSKTTEFVSEAVNGGIGDLDRLGAALLKMSLYVDVAATDLAKIAAAAGQQGLGRYGVEGIVQFTDSVSRMASVLDITSEEAATNIGKLINIFKVPLGEFERISSVINEVSNNSTASGKELLNVVKRIGDATGALNIEQSTALAASGLDFGMSPEVVGTSFSKIFAAAQEDADKFAMVVKGIAIDSGEVMNGSAKQWIEYVKRDGLEAFRTYLKGLRQLDASSQQLAIAKLTGGGRQGSMMNKFVQDTTDSVLLKNFKAAQEGNEGTSAIQEQARKLGTVAAQATILQNSLKKLGIEATAAFLPGISQLTAQLSKALQDPAVMSFVQNIFEAIANTVSSMVEFGKGIAALNINWENFIKVLKVFLTLKLVGFIGALISRVGFLGISLKSISNAANASAAATAAAAAGAAGAAGAGAAANATTLKGLIAQSLGLDGIIAKWKAYKIAAAEAAVAAQAANAAQSNASLASGALLRANLAAGATRPAVSAAGSGVAAARASVATVATRQAADAAALAAKQAARVAAVDAASNTRRLAIESAYQAKRAAIAATGTQVGLKAARTERAQLLAVEDASHQRSLRGVNSYYNSRILAQKALHKTEMAAERAQALQMALVLRRARQADSAARGAQGAAAAGAAAATAGAAAANTASLTMAAAAARARAALFSIGGALTAFGAVAAAAGRLIMSSFLWITIIYTIADMTGLLDKLGPTIRRVTDALGFTSVEGRNKAIALKAAIDEARKSLAELEAAQQAYRANVDINTGQQDLGNVAALATTAGTTDDPNRQGEAIGKLADLAVGAASKYAEAQKVIAGSTKAAADAVLADLTRLQAEYDVRLRDLTKATEQAPKFLKPFVSGSADKELTELKARLDEAAAKYKTFTDDVGRATGDLSGAKKDLDDFGKIIAAMFSPASAKALGDFVSPIAQASAEVIKLQEQQKEANQSLIESQKAVPAETLALQAKDLRNANALLDDAKKKLREFITQQSLVPGLSPEVLRSFQALNAFLSLSVPQVNALTTAIASVPTVGFTAALAPVAPPPATGTTPITFKTPRSSGGGRGESKARKEAKARMALETAMLEDISRIGEAADQQRLADEQRAFDTSLRTIEEYYDNRVDILQNGVTREISLKQQALKVVDDEIKNTKEYADRLRLGADKVRILSEIDVLEMSRTKILKETQNSRQDAVSKFNDELLKERNRLVGEGVISEDSRATFENNLNELIAGAKKKIDDLRLAGQGALADALLAGANKEALSRAFEPIKNTLDTLNSSVSGARTRVADAQARGSITAFQADKLQTALIEKQLPLMRDKLRILEETFARVKAANPLIPPAAFAAEAAAIDELRQSMERLADQQDAMAKGLNKSMSDSLGSALDKLSAGGSKLSDIFRDLFSDIEASLRKVFVDDLMSQIGGALELNGSGGFGGFVMKVLGGEGGKGNSVMERGNSPVTPLYVKDVNAVGDILGGGTVGESLDPLGDFIGKLSGSGQEAAGTDPLGDFIKKQTETKTDTASMLGEFASSFGSVLSNIAGSLSGSLGSLVSSIGSALSSLFGGGSGGGVMEGVFSFVASLFHSGGLVGAGGGMVRNVSPMLFANAPRYHNGGIAGLKPDEVPAILQKGERVLTKQQQNMPKSADGGATQSTPNVTIVQQISTPDAESFRRSRDQMAVEGMRAFNRAVKRNG